jgi:hypothetical protein
MRGDIIPPTESEANVREEVNRRTHRAGYTDRDGQPMTRLNPERQKINTKEYRENYVQIFGHH